MYFVFVIIIAKKDHVVAIFGLRILCIIQIDAVCFCADIPLISRSG